MNHLPFEQWSLDRSNLTKEQKVELAHHLETCPECRHLTAAWECARMEIKTAKRMEAPAGFTSRFQSSLNQRRALEHRRQTRKFLTILTVTLAVILVILGVYLLTQTSTTRWIGSIIRVIAGVPFQLIELQYIADFWLPQIPSLVWVGTGVIILAWLMILFLTGTLTYKRFHRQGVPLP